MKRLSLMISGLLVMAALVLYLVPQNRVDIAVGETMVRDDVVPAPAVWQSDQTVDKTEERHLLKPALQRVAVQYRHQNRWPEYSLPLSDSQTELIYPNQGAAIQHSLQPLGLDGELRIDMEHYRYRQGDQISVQVSLFGSRDLFAQTSQLQLTVTDRKKQAIQSLTA